MFKIMNVKTGLFSKGGDSPVFDKNGKIWKLRNHVTSHLTQLRGKKEQVYKDCVVIKYEMIEVDRLCDVADWKEAPSTTRSKELEAQRMAEFKAKRDLKRIKELEVELENLRK